MKGLGRTVILVALVLLLVVTACAKATPTPAPAAAPAVKKPVKLYYIPPLTGAWAAVVEPLWKGTTGYIDYINETMGGVSGHRVEYGWADSRYEAARTLTIYERFKGEGAFFVNIYGSPDGEALKPRAEADKIPLLNYGQSDPQVFPPAWNFIWGTTYMDAFAAWLEWQTANWKGPGPMKLGVVMIEYGWSLAHKDAAAVLAPKLGFEFVDSEVVPATITDATPFLARFRDKGVNIIYGAVNPPPFAVVSKDMTKLGLKERMPITNFWWGDLESNISLVGPEAADKTRNWTSWGSADDPDPGIATVSKYWDDKYGRKPRMAELVGWMGQELVMEALRLALVKAGDDPAKLTGEIMKSGFESIKDFEGILHPKVSLSPGDRITFRKLRLMEVQTKKEMVAGKETAVARVVPLTGWLDSQILPRTPDGKIDWAKYQRFITK